MSSHLSAVTRLGASEVPAPGTEPIPEQTPDEASVIDDTEVWATAAFQQRFWEAQMVFLTASRSRSGLLHLLEAAEQRAALLRLAQAGRELAAAQTADATAG